MSQPQSEPSIKSYTRSLSQLHTYSRCPEQFRLERLAKGPRQPAAWLPQGVALHAAIEAWERSDRQMDVEDAISIFTTEYDHGVQEMLDDWAYGDWLPDGVKKTVTSIEDRRETGQMHVRYFIADALAATWRPWRLPDGSPGVEIGFRLEFGTVPVVGYIDSVMEWPDGSLSPLDYKSKDSDQPDQLGLYALVLREVFEEDATTGYFWRGQLTSPKQENRRPKGLTDPIDLSRYTREYFTELFAEMDAGVRAGCFVPNSGQHCRVCPVQSACRAMGRNALSASVS